MTAAGLHPRSRAGTEAVKAQRATQADVAARRRRSEERLRAARRELVGDGDLTAQQLREKSARLKAEFYARQENR